MKKNILLILLVTSLFLISCGPVDFLPRMISLPLETTELKIEPQKDFYSVNEKITLFYSFDLDSEKFYKHEYHVSPSILKNGNKEICTSKILVFDEQGNNVTGKSLTCIINENNKITKQLSLVPQEAGSYIILVGGYVYTRKKEKGYGLYQCGRIFYLNVQ